ncbi:MAG: ROK family protein [Armatimonadetes bacterium]|nr:ROK family protein [Armatimonadota bacterium]
MGETCVIGVDLGGTNVRAMALAPDGTVTGERYEGPSFAQEGTRRIVTAVSDAVRTVASGCGRTVKGVGMAVPGHIDDAAGLVRWAPNFGTTVDGLFHYWKDVPLKSLLADESGFPIVLGNDANCAALGEYAYGSGKNSANCLVLLTLGTGIGGGVVMAPSAVQGRAAGPLLLLGGNKGGAELGHVTVARGGLDCNAGSYGAIEAYCQRDSIVRRAQHKLKRGRESLLSDIVGDDLGCLTPRHLSEAADRGDGLAIEVWREVGEYLGTGMGSFINVFAPDVLAIGGQVSKAGKWILGPAIAEARNVAIPSLFEDCRIVLAEQTEDAGILGAAALAWQTFGQA